MSVLCLGAQSTQSSNSDVNRAILERLDALETQNRELLAEIKALRSLVAAHGDPSSPPGPAPDTTADERQQVSEHRIEELAQTKVEASQRFPLQLTGTLLMNAFWNGAYGGGFQNPTSAALSPTSGNAGASFRQTVLGLTFRGPQTILGGNVSGSVYMDFFGGSSQSLNHLLRLRLATIQVDWPNTTFAVGQDKPLVSRREPNSLAQVGVSPLTNAGNPWLWQPQARLEQRFKLSEIFSIKAETGIFQTAETANQPAGVTEYLATARPASETRIAITRRTDDDHIIEIAPVLHFSASHVAGNSIASRLYGVDWLIKPHRQFEITGLAFRGRNFANLGALTGISVDANNQFQAIHGAGGWMQFRYLASSRVTLDAYGGLEDDRNRDLTFGRIAKNQYVAGNVMYLLAPNLIGAFEFGQNRTTYFGLGNRVNNHYDLALGYLF